MSSPRASDQPRWLVIAEEEFVPTDSGGRVETLNMLQAFEAAGLALHVLVPGLAPTAAPGHQAVLPDAAIQALPRRKGWRSHASMAPFVFASRPMDPAVADQLEIDHRHRPFEAVVATSFRVAHLGGALAERLGLPLLVRPHNIESNYFAETADSARFPKSVFYRAEAAKLRRAEAAIHGAPWVTLFADISQSDAALRVTATPTPVISVPPFLPPRSTRWQDGPAVSRDDDTVLFIGSLDSPHNVDGLRWFVKECWPDLHRGFPAVSVRVVGRRPSGSLVAELSRVGIEAVVDAPEIQSYLARAAVFINPVRQGSGVNIKVVEAMAAGVPVVASTVGARGVAWRSGEHLLVADDAVSFREAIEQLLSSPERRTRMGEAGQNFVRRELDGVRQVNRMRAILTGHEHP